MMLRLESVEFENYRVLRAAKLPLGQCTLILGPNGAGKSTAMTGLLSLVRSFNSGVGINIPPFLESERALSADDLTVGLPKNTRLRISAACAWNGRPFQVMATRTVAGNIGPDWPAPAILGADGRREATEWMLRFRHFSLDASEIAKPAQSKPLTEILANGANLCVVLAQLQDRHPERFESLNRELSTWLPEFDHVLFDTTPAGLTERSLRTRSGGRAIRASDLSHGTLLVLCILGLAHLPEPPTLVCLEEPDRGIHPRLVRLVHDAMVRLSDPAACGDSREPVQVISTTHSPYFLDLFRDHPEDVVIAERQPDGATFRRLTDMPHYQDIMQDAPLGEAWYTGILGGVPATP